MKNKITMIELFSGVGAQERALRQLNTQYEVINTCDCDANAVLSYAAMRYDLKKEIETFEFPSQDEMIKELQKKNFGYDFMKGKHGITTRTKLDKLKQYYIADKLSNNLGDIGQVEKLPYSDIVTYSFPCFVPGTMVLTDIGYKNIEDVQEGDMVLTHTNQYQRVIKTMKNYCDSYVYKINTMCSDPIYVTEEHPFYVRKRYRAWNNTKRMYDRKFNAPEWIKAKDLTKDCYVGIAINQKSEIPKWNGIEFHWSDGRKDRYSNKLHECINKEDFWWIIGRYLGDGWIRSDAGIIICCASDETKEITSVLDRLNWNYNIVNERTVNKIHISFKEIDVFCSQFGKGASNKHLTADILNLPVGLLKSFLDGYISADGCFTQNKYRATSVSRELIYGIAQCVAKVYHTPFSVYKTARKSTCIIEGREVNQKDSYSIAFKTDKRKQDKAFYEDGYIWCPINNISTESYDGYVYNMEVENDNSYVVQNIIVHNCTDLSVAGKGEGMVNKCNTCGHSWAIDFSNSETAQICPKCGNVVSSSTRSGLLGQVQRLLDVANKENTLPKYLLLENVKNLVGKKFIGQFEAWVKWLDSIGYNTYYKVLNAKNYGIPQNRERIFAISIRKDIDTHGFTFPDQIPLTIRLKDILEKYVDEKYYLPDERIDKILNSTFMQEKKRIQTKNVYDTLLTRDWKDHKCVQVEDDINVIGNYMPSNHDASRIVDINGIAPCVEENHGTVTAIAEPNVVEEQEPFIVASRGRDASKESNSKTEQHIEPNFSGATNCLTSVAKDNYVVEPQVLRAERTEYGKSIRKQYEAGEIDEKIGNMREMKPRNDGISNTITTVIKDNYVYEPIIYDDYNSRISSDQNAINTLATNCSVHQPSANGVKTIEPIVCEERKDEGIRLFKDDCVGTLRTIDACGDKRVIEPKLVGGIGECNFGKQYRQGNRVYDSDEIAMCLNAQPVGNTGGYSYLYAVNQNNIKWRIRKLTPKECWRLMGFSDSDHNKAAEYVSASALYKQAGNSIYTGCLVAIFNSLLMNDSSEKYSTMLVDYNN